MTAQEAPDSLPSSEAVRMPKPLTGTTSPVHWKYCSAHGLWFLFSCCRCEGGVVPAYGT